MLSKHAVSLLGQQPHQYLWAAAFRGSIMIAEKRNLFCFCSFRFTIIADAGMHILL